jgi:hypothetical protein
MNIYSRFQYKVWDFDLQPISQRALFTGKTINYFVFLDPTSRKSKPKITSNRIYNRTHIFNSNDRLLVYAGVYCHMSSTHQLLEDYRFHRISKDFS